MEIFQVILQDIKAAVKAFEREDFDMMNIFANRIMADAVFGDDKKLALPGFFLKHVAFIYGDFKARLSAPDFSKAKSIVNDYMNYLTKVTSDFSEDDLWQRFHEFNNKIREYTLNEFEMESYEDNPSFTHYAFKWLIKYLDEKRNILLSPDNLFLKGIINEMSRIFRVYGCELTDTYALSLILALDRYYDYFRFAYKTQTGVNENKVREIVFPFVEEISKLLSSDEIKAQDVDNILWELIKGWREFFIHYMELGRPAIERRLELPEEAKKKIGESIQKVLKEEVKPRG